MTTGHNMVIGAVITWSLFLVIKVVSEGITGRKRLVIIGSYLGRCAGSCVRWAGTDSMAPPVQPWMWRRSNTAVSIHRCSPWWRPQWSPKRIEHIQIPLSWMLNKKTAVVLACQHHFYVVSLSKAMSTSSTVFGDGGRPRDRFNAITRRTAPNLMCTC